MKNEVKIFRYKCIIEYDGSCFFGWQLQPNVKTVQGEVERVLKKVLQEDIRIQGSGRTDTGVHARGQVFHFDTAKEINAEKLKLAFNGLLGIEAVIHSIEAVDSNFNARFSASSRTYKYYISEEVTALRRNYSHYVPRTLNLDLLNSYAELLHGEHDFTSFSKFNEGVEKHDSIIYNAAWRRQNHEVIFEVSAIRFLRGMVRGLVGTSLFCEKQNRSPKEFKTILEAKDRAIAKFHAPAKALVLEKVEY